MSWRRGLYSALLWLLLPWIGIRLLLRGRKDRRYLQRIGERFGIYRVKIDAPVIWLHAVSVGETRAAASLIEALIARYPGHRVLLTHTTPTGMATSEALFGASVERVYLPYDYPFAIRRFLGHFKPVLGILMETELWINLIAEAQNHAIPMLLLNGRLSARSFKRYARFANLSKEALDGLRAIAAQSAADAQRFASLCGGEARIRIMGNLKYDIQPSQALMQLGLSMRKNMEGNRPVILAASTREGEEEIILDAVAQCSVQNLLTIIVPRHPQRFDEVATLIASRGLSMQRRSAGGATASTTLVLLGDSMGEMYAYLCWCDIACMGGSFLPYGGQNLIEACAVGKPVIIGPHTYNFAEASDLAVAAGAALRIENGKALGQALLSLLNEPLVREKMGTAGRQFVSQNRGATQRAMEIIAESLPA